MSPPPFRELAPLMQQARALADLPEAHGTLAGAFCAGQDFTFEDWLREVFPEGAPGPAEGAMQAVFDWTRRSLEAGDLLDPLLPDAEVPVAERAPALGEWCQGFLYGLGTRALPDPEQLPGQVAEVVRDLTAITRVGVDEDESEEENEQAYAELVEFVRVAVQLLHEELAPFREEPTRTPPDVPPASLH
jgi:uncharacterized protein YgfB (UPF0149 family)